MVFIHHLIKYTKIIWESNRLECGLTVVQGDLGCCGFLHVVHQPTFKTYVLAADITDRKYTEPTLRHLADFISMIIIRIKYSQLPRNGNM